MVALMVGATERHGKVYSLSLSPKAVRLEPMESVLDHHTARVLLEWQVELGATEAIGDAPVDRYALPDTQPGAAKAAPAQAVAKKPAEVDAVKAAQQDARAAGSLEALQAAMRDFKHCDLKRGARQLVFADGAPGARVMIIGEAPGREEDRVGKPFVGAAGQLLDKMLAAIGLNRSETVYITNVLPWRPPQNRDPNSQEIAMMTPFLERHVALAAPDILIPMGNISCQAVLGKRGVTRLRGTWGRAFDLPVLPMFHPAYLLRSPQMKRQAWADLLELQAWLRSNT